MRTPRSTSMNFPTPAQYRAMERVVDRLCALPIAVPFLKEVTDDEAPGYSARIQKPVWLERVVERLQDSYYPSVEKWREDVNQIWKNARKFNGEDSVISAMATELETLFKEWSEEVTASNLEKWVSQMKKAHEDMSQLMYHCPILEM